MDIRSVDILPVDEDLPLEPGAGYQVVHPVEQPQEGGLAAAGGPDEGDHLILRYLHRDALQGVEGPVVEINVPCFDFLHLFYL